MSRNSGLAGGCGCVLVAIAVIAIMTGGDFLIKLIETIMGK